MLLTVTAPNIASPCTTTRIPLPIAEPESLVPWVPITLPSILPTSVCAVGPVSAPAPENALIALDFIPVMVVLFNTWNVMFEICERPMSMPCPLSVNVLVCTVKLFCAAGATIAPPEFWPIRPESFVCTWTPTPRTPLNVEPLTSPQLNTDVPRIVNSRPSFPIDPEGWHGWPAAHEMMLLVIVNDAML